METYEAKYTDIMISETSSIVFKKLYQNNKLLKNEMFLKMKGYDDILIEMFHVIMIKELYPEIKAKYFAE